MNLRERVLRPESLVVAVCLLALVAHLATARTWLVYNATHSLPEGFYRLYPDGEIRRGSLVWIDLPEGLQQLVERRGYIPRRGRLAKYVVGVPGDRWCVTDSTFSVAGEAIGPVLSVDSKGRPLPEQHGCEVVPANHVLVSTSHPRSFDSRYFGPVPLEDIRGTLEAVWTW